MSENTSILDIYDAFAAKDVTVAGSVAYQTITTNVKNLTELPEVADTAMLPLRLLLPLGTETEQDHSESFVSFGNNALTEMTWKITDLCLWRRVTDGIGLASVAPDLVKYTAAYMNMLRGFRYPTSQPDYNDSIVVGARASRGAFEYPTGSGMWYHGVECVVTILELLP